MKINVLLDNFMIFKGITLTKRIQNKINKVFGRLCCIAIEKNLDLENILAYSLTPLPLSLVHIDGTIAKTDKSQLLRHIESKVITESPCKIDFEIVDEMFFLHTLPQNMQETYDALSSYILTKLVNSKA